MFSTYQALCLSHFIVFSLILWVQLYFREGRWSLEKLKECPNHKAFKLPRPDSNEVKVLVTQSCLTLGDPMDCSPPGSSVHGILLARILESVAIPFSRRFSWSRDPTWVYFISGGFFTFRATSEAHKFKRPQVHFFIIADELENNDVT